MNDAAIYCRYSPRPDNGDGAPPEDHDSLETQIERCTAYCAFSQLNPALIIRDPATSARKIPMPERVGGKQLLDLTTVRPVQYRHVVAYKLDRLFRDVVDGLVTLDRWRRCGVVMHLASEGGQAINTATATGEFFATILLAKGKHEARQTSERTSDAMRRYQRDGRRMGRPTRVPYGMNTDPNNLSKLIPNDAEQAVIERIMTLHDGGASPYTISLMLNEDGTPGRSGRWFPTQIERIVRRAAVA